MADLTLNNHFQFGRIADDDTTFVAQCGPTTTPLQSALKEAQRSAELINDLARDLQPKLCLSGGIDSACMLESFASKKIPFEAVFLKFNNALNDFDIKTNIQLCEEKKIKYSVVDLDIIHFFDSGLYFEIAQKYECQSPQIATHLWLLDQIDGFPVLSGNPIMPIWNNDTWFFMGLPGELHCSYFKYFYIRERKGVPWFFLYTPELIASFFHLEASADFLSKKKTNLKDYSYLQKCLSYEQAGFAARPRTNKFTGFELVRKYFDEKYNTTHGTGFDRYFRHPLEKQFPFPDKYIQLVPNNYFPPKLPAFET